MVITMAVVGDIFTPRERGRYQGIFGGVFGFSTVLGPLIGGFFVEHLSWRWIFYINLPLGIIAIAIIGLTFTSPTSQRRPAIDGVGAACLAVTLTALILLTSLGGSAFSWDSRETLMLMLLVVVGLGGFVIAGAPGRRADRPADAVWQSRFRHRLRGRLYRRPRYVRLCHLYATVLGRW